jgi:hypothetical protein
MDRRAATDEFCANVRAFLDWLTPGDRRLWAELLCDREPLVAAFRSVPHTLLHSDADVRNIGLQWVTAAPTDAGGTENTPEVVFID